jgi:sterol desaturase/sphingolipid hydroxylase (fatty acid hydroxylase superfamily)
MPYTNSNYGDVFSVWDHLFRTHATLDAANTDIGLDTHLHPAGDAGFVEALGMPFERAA